MKDLFSIKNLIRVFRLQEAGDTESDHKLIAVNNSPIEPRNESFDIT